MKNIQFIDITRKVVFRDFPNYDFDLIVGEWKHYSYAIKRWSTSNNTVGRSSTVWRGASRSPCGKEWFLLLTKPECKFNSTDFYSGIWYLVFSFYSKRFLTMKIVSVKFTECLCTVPLFHYFPFFSRRLNLLRFYWFSLTHLLLFLGVSKTFSEEFIKI